MTQRTTLSLSIRTLVALAIGVLAFMVVWDLRSLVLVVGIALVIATFMNGPIELLMKIKVPRVVATILVYCFLVGIFGLVVVLLIPVFMNEVQSFVQLLPKDSQITAIVNLVTDSDTLKTLASSESTPRQTATLAKTLQPLFSGDGGLISSSTRVVTSIVNTVLTMVLAFYFSIEESGIDRFLRIITPREREDYVVGLWHRVRRKISLWFKGQVILAAVLGVLTYCALLLLGVPYVLLLSLLALVLSIIPFGIVLAIIPAVIVAYMAGGLPLALIVLGIYIVLQQIENHVFQPIFVKRATGLPPVVVIISLAAGVAVAGVPGLLVAVPVAVLLLELLSDHEQRRRADLQS